MKKTNVVDVELNMAFSSWGEFVGVLEGFLSEESVGVTFTSLKARLEYTMDNENNPLGIRFKRVLGDYYYSDFQLFCIFYVILAENSARLDKKYTVVGNLIEAYRRYFELTDAEIFELVDDREPVNELFFARGCILNKDTLLASRLLANKKTMSFIAGTDTVFYDTPDSCRFYDLPESDIICNEKTIDYIAKVSEADIDSNILIITFGKVGCGRSYSLAKGLERGLLKIDLDYLASIDENKLKPLLTEISLTALARDYVPCIEAGASFLATFEGQVLYKFVIRYLKTHFSIVTAISDSNIRIELEDFTTVSYEIEKSDGIRQSKLWEYEAKRFGVSLGEYTGESLANLYTLTPGQIEKVCREILVTAPEASEKKQDIRNIISKILLAYTKDRLAGVAEHLKASFTRDDLVLPEKQTELVEFIIKAAKQRYVVNEKMGFGKKLPYGKGHALLMYGPPGTGKTMSAQVIANEIGLELFRVDSSKLTDKYIGETQKKIGQLFDAAEDCNAILFFDEADALFSKRTEVQSSNDKHANADVSYLLQRIEQYSGLTIMATNHANDFDDAFKRRITYYLNIPIPDPATRLVLWQKVFPEGVTLAKNVDLEYLANKYDFTGASIKYVATMAAYHASIQGTDIDKDAILMGIQLEFGRGGRLFSSYEY